MAKDVAQLFAAGVELARTEFHVDAIEKFKEAMAADPKGELADDAVYNIGLCYFKMSRFETALAQFRNVIEEYPDSTIADDPTTNEYGRTVAKAHLGMLNCYLALGQEDKAREALEALAQFDDSYVIQGPDGLKRTFCDIGRDLLEEYEAGGATEVSAN